jgi:hypothetical protein
MYHSTKDMMSVLALYLHMRRTPRGLIRALLSELTCARLRICTLCVCFHLPKRHHNQGSDQTEADYGGRNQTSLRSTPTCQYGRGRRRQLTVLSTAKNTELRKNLATNTSSTYPTPRYLYALLLRDDAATSRTLHHSESDPGSPRPRYSQCNGKLLASTLIWAHMGNVVRLTVVEAESKVEVILPHFS